MKRTLGKYKITYHNGIVQEKYLINQLDFENMIKPSKEIIKSMENDGIDASNLKKWLKDNFSDDFFTTESIMADAIKTGILLQPPNQGGSKPCLVEKLCS